MHALLIHTATVVRMVDTITAQKRQSGETTISAVQECRFSRVGGSPELSILGRDEREGWKAYFPNAADVQVGDQLTWNERAGFVFLLEGLEEKESLADPYVDHHLEGVLVRQKQS
jgi:hypothetical protein